MHHYPHHIGDYRSHTAHLSNDEDLAYRRLLEMYYDTEHPIPLDTQWVSRRLRVYVSDVETVLNDFFDKTEDGWVNQRCEKEIAEYRRISERNRLNGMKGGRKKNPVGSQSQPSGNPDQRQPITNNQYPITNNQEDQNILVPDESDTPDQPGPEKIKQPDLPDCPHEQIVTLYHEILPTLAQVRLMTDQRKKTLRARWREDPKRQNLAFWRRYFEYVAQSDFLMGRIDGNRKWEADFDFLTNASKFVAIVEGKYHK